MSGFVEAVLSCEHNTLRSCPITHRFNFQKADLANAVRALLRYRARQASSPVFFAAPGTPSSCEFDSKATSLDASAFAPDTRADK
jgi:hypothetical protein